MKICNNCQQTNPLDAAFCRQCASPLGAGQAQQQYQNPPPQFGQQQQWNQPNQPNYPVAPQNNMNRAAGGASTRAMAAAGLAVAGLFCCGFLTGIPAAIMGWLELNAIKEGKAPVEGQMMAQVGLWLGIAGTIINAVVNFFLLIMMSLGGGGGY
jgi:hypothetical protein